MLRPDDREFGKRFQDLLLDKRHDHVEGWHLCQDLGRPAVAVLWELYGQQGADVRKRMVLMVAAALAGGPAEDERLLQALDSAKVEERVLAAMLMALGPRRPVTAANPWSRLVGKQKTPPVALQVAAYLAASRFPAAAADRQLPAPEAEPGLYAAAAAAGVAGIDMGPWFPPASRPPHADLVRRGALLGRMSDPAPDQQFLLKAESLLRSDSEPDETRVCAALLLGRAGRLPATSGRDAMARPSWLLVEGLAGAPAAARSLREWLDPVPNQLDKDPRRLLSAYVFSRSVAEVLADQERWLASPTARRPVTLSLALRLLAGEAAPPALSATADLPEWFWVAWAADQHPPRPSTHGEDAVLEQAVDLAIEGRLPRATARVLIEEALWRSESHPGLALWRSWRALVRDLLLAGSNPGIKYAPTAAKPYRAPGPGLGPEHPLFEVAVEYFDFTDKPRSPLPPECRLP